MIPLRGDGSRRLLERRRDGAGRRLDQQAISMFVRRILDGSPLPTVTIDRRGQVVQSNVAALRLFGCSDLPRNVTALVEEADRAAMITAWAGGGRWSGTVANLPGAAPGEVLSMTVSGLGDAALDGYCAVAVFEKSDTPQATRHGATVASVIIVGTTIVSATPAALDLLRARRESDLVGNDVFDFVAAASVDEVTTRHASADAGRWPTPDVIVLRRLDGVELTVEIASTPVSWGSDGASQVTMWKRVAENSGRRLSSTHVSGDVAATAIGSDPVGLSSEERQARRASPAVGVADAALRDELRGALRRNELVVHYQPIVELAAGTAIGVEALVRWNHPTRGLLYPADFVDAAERLGMIGDLGEVVLETACNQLVSWRRQGRDLSLAVNVSALQLIDRHFSRNLEAILTRTRIEAQHLWLEITETALVEDVAQATVALRAIDALGVKIAIDDFGTGWASLTYLREFPVHALKIDRTFVDGLGCTLRDEAIVRSIVQMGLELGLDVIAEGIETPDQHAALIALGCTTGQGYLFARPAPADMLFERDGVARRLTRPDPRLRTHDHGVHLYADDDELVRSVADSFETAIADGDATLLVATAAHRRAIEAVLAARGIDLARHDHHALDADATLDMLLVDGAPDPQRFTDVVGSVVTELCATRSGVTIYGELVGILWDRGEVLAALNIENLWNDLGSRMSFSLSCGYRNGGRQTLLELEDVCAVHTHIAGWSPLASAGAGSRGGFDARSR